MESEKTSKNAGKPGKNRINRFSHKAQFSNAPNFGLDDPTEVWLAPKLAARPGLPDGTCKSPKNPFEKRQNALGSGKKPLGPNSGLDNGTAL